MTLPSDSTDRVLNIYIALAQYPTLRVRMRARMRRELFERGVITPHEFEAAVREKAIESQAREGLHDPLQEEPAEVWETRLARVRSHMTDFYFAYNLPYELFERIMHEVLAERGAQAEHSLTYFNPELAPQHMLFEQGSEIEAMPDEQRARVQARLHEIKVVLIRRMISDQLAYINIARDWFTVNDLMEINRRKIGQGKIGGKAAGMLLAARILNEVGDADIRDSLRIPESFFLGSDVMYTYMAVNNLIAWNDQKYKPEAEIRAQFPQIQREYLAGTFPNDIAKHLREVLAEVGDRPLIVRSSSLLEDNFGTSFAGKYESVFCPNQGGPEKNFLDLTQAIAQVYASVVNPDALLYRRSKGLQDYDERMGILIQVVEGERRGRFYLPHAAGVAFSRNLYRWSPQIRQEDGFVRLVWGLGTRAVDQVGNDYPRLVALSHPSLRPEASPKDIRRYSQGFVDVIDLEANAFRTLPVGKVLEPRDPVLRYLAQVDQDGYFTPVRSLLRVETGQMVLTFEEFLRRTPFADRVRRMLKILEAHYHSPVDSEFTARIVNPEQARPEIEITLLQCRPQSHFRDREAALPHTIAAKDIVFSTQRMIPEGHVEGIKYVVFVAPEAYFTLPSEAARLEVGRAISRLNASLGEEKFICVGPGRWGTRNSDLGVFIGYSDIYNTRALVELAGKGIGALPEPSFGTHFFQDLIEANIFPLAVFLDDPGVLFNRDFFYGSRNQIAKFISLQKRLKDTLRLIKVSAFRKGHHLDLIMDAEQGRAVAYLVPDEEAS